MLGLSQITLTEKDIRMTGLLLGAVDTFIHKPGTSLVPIVKQIHSTLLETVRMLQNTELLSYMEEGRKMKISDMMDMVLDKKHVVSPISQSPSIHAKA